MHVAYNSFRKGIEAYGEATENLCIDLFYFFKLSASRREYYLTIQQKLDLEEIVFLRHVELRWLSLLPAVERVKSWLPALLEYFKKLPDTDKKIKSNERYKKIMVILTAPETIVQLCFLKSIKPFFQQIPTDVSNRRTSDPHTTSSYAGPVEANDVMISEAKCG